MSFAHLEQDIIELIVDKMVAELEEQLSQKRVSLVLEADARRWLAKRGYDRTFGARPMSRLIDKEIRRKLADEMLFGSLSDGGVVRVAVDEDTIVLRYEPRPTKKASSEKASVT